MSPQAPNDATLDDWIARDATRFEVDAPASVNAVVDTAVASLGESVELLGFGEALHGGEEILKLRNRFFQRLVEAHGYSAIAVESSFPRARLVNEYVAGRGSNSYESLQEAGFSHGFGRLDANRELVEWMRQYNADGGNRVKLRLYGFDSPTEMTVTDSPRQLLHFALEYLASIDAASAEQRRERIDPLLGEDADWENPAAAFDPAKSIGLSPAASALRIEAEDLITELCVRQPELITRTDAGRYREATQHAFLARQMLNYHAGLARPSNNRVAELLGLRDVMMADNLAYMVSRERGRGKVFAFAHNSHLKCGSAQWQLGPMLLQWWPAGAHLRAMLGPRYAVLGTAVGVSEENGIGPPEAGTLEERLAVASEPASFIPTRQARALPAAAIAMLPIRTGSMKNQTYFALGPLSVAEFDGLVFLNSITYNRGGPPLP